MIDAKDFELVPDIGKHSFGRVIRIPIPVTSPLSGAVTTDATADDDFIAPDNALFDGDAKFAQGVAVASRTVEVVNPNIDGVAHEVARLVIRNRSKVPAEPLSPKWDNGDRKFGFTPPSARNAQVAHEP